MGIEYGFSCPKCNYRIFISLGVGFLFPIVYQETVEKAKAGEFGDTVKEFLNTFPEGRIDAETALYVCRECGNMEVLPELSMYIPKGELPEKDENLPWSVAFSFKGVSYVTHNDLEKDYELFEEYKHKCSKCHGDYTLLTRYDIPNGMLKCPHCKEVLVLHDIGHSD